MAISPQEYLNMYRARKPIQIIHPWLRGTRKDVIDVLTYLKRRFLAGWIEDVGAAFLSTISETAKKVTSALGLTSEEQRQTTVSTASVMKNYTQSLIDKINWLANRYPEPGTYMKYGERGTHVETLQQVINMLGIVSPPLEEDGKYGAKTYNAVKKLQSMVGVDTDGLFGFHTAQALKSYINDQVQKSTWWQKLLNLVYPIVAYVLKKPSEQVNTEQLIKQSMSTGQPAITVAAPAPREEKKKGPFGLSWPVFIGIAILAFLALKGSAKEA